MLGWLRIRPRQAAYLALKRFVEEIRDGQPTSEDARLSHRAVPGPVDAHAVTPPRPPGQ